MAFPAVSIGKHRLEIPIIQGGMGVGISWDNLAGAVSREGALGVISAVGTGYYKAKSFVEKMTKSGRPLGVSNFYNKNALFEIIKNAKEKAGNRPVGANILYAINDYGRVVKDACAAGIDIIITGAGLPMNMPEFAKDFPSVSLVPIVSSVKALRLIAKRWEQRYKKIPDAVILEGPLSGGHQGFTYEQCFLPEFQLENLVTPVSEEAKKIGKIPVFAAGGIWDKKDIEKMISLGASGVQMGTRFIGTHECDASYAFKEILLNAKKEDIELIKSPVGYPARAIKTKLMDLIEKKIAPKVACASNCVAPCKSGIEAKAVGYCIADRLSDAYNGIKETGLFFTGSNGYRLNEIISVKELLKKLINGE
ncbi:MAG: nitronate monooxygenase [Helicobacteraceae bacterium]